MSDLEEKIYHFIENQTEKTGPCLLMRHFKITHEKAVEYLEKFQHEEKPISSSIKIEVSLKKAYGNDRFYPINEFAKTICRLVRGRTQEAVVLTKEQLKICKEAGWEVVVQMPEYRLE